jgi:hypothetical protein
MHKDCIARMNYTGASSSFDIGIGLPWPEMNIGVADGIYYENNDKSK